MEGGEASKDDIVYWCMQDVFKFVLLTINTDVLTASETLCLSSAAVPGLLSPRVNFLASAGAEAMV